MFVINVKREGLNMVVFPLLGFTVIDTMINCFSCFKIFVRMNFRVLFFSGSFYAELSYSVYSFVLLITRISSPTLPVFNFSSCFVWLPCHYHDLYHFEHRHFDLFHTRLTKFVFHYLIYLY